MWSLAKADKRMNPDNRKFLLLPLLLAGCLISFNVSGQNNRTRTQQQIGWYNTFGKISLSDRWSVHAEYQWRRNELITEWQQSLLRLGISYQPQERLLLRAGYGWIETYPYGEIPLNSLGRDFTEHRIFEMIQFTGQEGRFDISHRFMLEQRFIGKYASAASEKEDVFPLQNRIRYMLRLQAPLNREKMQDKTLYAAFFDELFIGFGKNVAVNVFDQNRCGLVLGYRVNKNLRLEAGYLNQILQLGRLVEGKNVFQYNSGLIINTYFSTNSPQRKKSAR